MGWLFGWNDRKSLIEEVTRRYESEAMVQEVIRKYASGNNLWTVFEQTQKATAEKKRFIVVFLIRGGNNCTGGQGHGWGYKDVSEDMGPCEVSCPLAFLDMVPDPGGYSTDWRKKVRAYHARRSQKVVAGQTVRLTNGQDYKITKVLGFNRIVGIDQRGNEFLIPRAMLTLPETQAVQS